MNFQDFKEKYEKVAVEHYPHKVSETPVVSVCVQTYNHAPYIKDCLNGILMQKTDFPFEILLGEDESSDSTREICLEYANKYPDKIKLFLHKRENNIKIGGSPSGRFNFLYNLYSAKGKYIALCEGDDFWTDPLKLQKQVEFMEENEDYVGCFTNYRMVNQKGETLLEKARHDDHVSYYDRLTMLEAGVPQTCTVIYRNLPNALSQTAQVKNALNGDQVLAAFMAQNGKIKFLNEVSASRRVGSGTFSTINKEKQKLATLNTFQVLKKHFGKDDEIQSINKRINEIYIDLIINSVKQFKLKKAFAYENERSKKTGLPFKNKFKKFINYFMNGIRFRIKKYIS